MLGWGPIHCCLFFPIFALGMGIHRYSINSHRRCGRVSMEEWQLTPILGQPSVRQVVGSTQRSLDGWSLDGALSTLGSHPNQPTMQHQLLQIYKLHEFLSSGLGVITIIPVCFPALLMWGGWVLSGECIINHTTLTTLGGGSHATGVTLGKYQVRRGRCELNVKWQE